MQRSMTPLHSGSPTYDGEIVIPSDFTSLIQASAMDGGPPVAADRESPGDVNAALVLLFGLVAGGQIRLRRLDGWRQIPAVLRPGRRPAA